MLLSLAYLVGDLYGFLTLRMLASNLDKKEVKKHLIDGISLLLTGL